MENVIRHHIERLKKAVAASKTEEEMKIYQKELSHMEDLLFWNELNGDFHKVGIA